MGFTEGRVYSLNRADYFFKLKSFFRIKYSQTNESEKELLKKNILVKNEK